MSEEKVDTPVNLKVGRTTPVLIRRASSKGTIPFLAKKNKAASGADLDEKKTVQPDLERLNLSNTNDPTSTSIADLEELKQDNSAENTLQAVPKPKDELLDSEPKITQNNHEGAQNSETHQEDIKKKSASSILERTPLHKIEEEIHGFSEYDSHNIGISEKQTPQHKSERIQLDLVLDVSVKDDQESGHNKTLESEVIKLDTENTESKPIDGDTNAPASSDIHDSKEIEKEEDLTQSRPTTLTTNTESELNDPKGTVKLSQEILGGTIKQNTTDNAVENLNNSQQLIQTEVSYVTSTTNELQLELMPSKAEIQTQIGEQDNQQQAHPNIDLSEQSTEETKISQSVVNESAKSESGNMKVEVISSKEAEEKNDGAANSDDQSEKILSLAEKRKILEAKLVFKLPQLLIEMKKTDAAETINQSDSTNEIIKTQDSFHDLNTMLLAKPTQGKKRQASMLNFDLEVDENLIAQANSHQVKEQEHSQHLELPKGGQPQRSYVEHRGNELQASYEKDEDLTDQIRKRSSEYNEEPPQTTKEDIRKADHPADDQGELDNKSGLPLIEKGESKNNKGVAGLEDDPNESIPDVTKATNYVGNDGKEPSVDQAPNIQTDAKTPKTEPDHEKQSFQGEPSIQDQIPENYEVEKDLKKGQSKETLQMEEEEKPSIKEESENNKISYDKFDNSSEKQNSDRPLSENQSTVKPNPLQICTNDPNEHDDNDDFDDINSPEIDDRQPATMNQNLEQPSLSNKEDSQRLHPSATLKEELSPQKPEVIEESNDQTLVEPKQQSPKSDCEKVFSFRPNAAEAQDNSQSSAVQSKQKDEETAALNQDSVIEKELLVNYATTDSESLTKNKTMNNLKTSYFVPAEYTVRKVSQPKVPMLNFSVLNKPPQESEIKKPAPSQLSKLNTQNKALGSQSNSS